MTEPFTATFFLTLFTSFLMLGLVSIMLLTMYHLDKDENQNSKTNKSKKHKKV